MNKKVFIGLILLTLSTTFLFISEKEEEISHDLAIEMTSKTTQQSVLIKHGDVNNNSEVISSKKTDEAKVNPDKKEKVLAAIDRFNEKLSRISREDLEEEQERLKEAKEKYLAIKAPTPKEEEYIDENGTKWVKLTYPNGEVRYDFP